ncbi:tyrosine-type recombinase/integrase [Kallipyga massiliensis]|uniref:tyrosine-type recombinase/integrase n=1 Tax=Kallipyga massiliensis TaxID=1472764 RepID=UPI00155B0E4E|nr:site-specific integrase [Kallipyga massiliensis]
MIKKIRMCVSAPYAWAERSLGLAVVSPTLGLVYKVKEKKTTKRDRVIKDEDLARFLEASDRTKYRVYFRLLATTGLRPSEGLGIQAKDLEGGTLHIRRAITRQEFSDLKPSTARRDIPLTPEMASLLYEQRRMTLFQTKKGLLFPSGGGAPYMKSVESCFKRCLKATTVYKRGGHNHLKKLSVITPPVRFSLYDFRHTFATKMAEKGMGAKILQYLMGHADIATTLSYYVGITPTMKEEAALMMAEII